MAVVDRVEACLAAFDHEKIDLLLGFTGSIHNFLLCEPVFMFTGYKTIDSSVVIMDRRGQRTLIVTPECDGVRAIEQTEDVRIIPTDNLISALSHELSQAQLTNKRIGVAGLNLLPQSLATELSLAIGPDAKAVDHVVRWIGRRKNPDEIKSAIRATEIAEKGYEHLLRTIKSGIREFELAAELYCHMKGLGAEDNFLVLSSSAHNLCVRGPRQRVILEGDIVLVELTPCVDGQFSQVCRTISIGEPAAVLREKYKILQRATEVGLATAKAGVSVSELATAMDDVFRNEGYAEYCRPPYMRVRGHGLGFLSDLPGDISVDNKSLLEPDMIFMMHPNQYLPETGYLMCGETIQIQEHSAIALTKLPSMLDCVSI